MTVVSITDEIADLTLDQLARAAAMQAAPQVRRRPPTSMVFCKKLRLEGPWGTVRHGDIVSRWHPAVARNEEWFVETSVGYDPGSTRSLRREPSGSPSSRRGGLGRQRGGRSRAASSRPLRTLLHRRGSRGRGW